jgi:hypothetical protein
MVATEICRRSTKNDLHCITESSNINDSLHEYSQIILIINYVYIKKDTNFVYKFATTKLL